MKAKGSSNWGLWRFLVQTLAFLLIFSAPLLNYYFHIDFVQGWYQSISIGRLWFVSPLEGFESILTSRLVYTPLLIGMVIPVLLALLLGRVFCAWICPISFFSEVIDRIFRLLSGKRYRKDRLTLIRQVFWFALLGELFLAMVLGTPIFVFLSPPGLVGRQIMMAVFFHAIAIEGIIVVLVLGLHLLTRRFFCRYLCPLGALLGVIGSKRRLVVTRDEDKCNECGLCKRACPLGLNPAGGDSLSAYCWNCGECIDACRQRALDFTFREIRVSDRPHPVHPVQNGNPPQGA